MWPFEKGSCVSSKHRRGLGEAGSKPAPERKPEKKEASPVPLKSRVKETVLCYNVLGNTVVLSLVPQSYGS